MAVNILDILYEQEFKKMAYNARKLNIDAKKVILRGPKRAGKSYMIFDKLSQLQKGEFLYIDFDDLRIDAEFIKQNLEKFVRNKPIKLLILENFDFSFALPFCEEIIITTNQNKKLDGFEVQTLYPLDFEEFISFNKGQLNVKNLFNSYASYGTFPEIVLLEKINFIKNLQLLVKSLVKSDTEFAILKEFAIAQGLKLSMFQLFNKIKQHHKVSKDKFYNFVKELQEQKIIFLVEKYGQPRASKKIFLIDFAIKGVLSFKKDFITRFENIIFLELLKHKKEIFYTDFINFYIPDEQKAILSYPFLPPQMIRSKIENLTLHDIKIVQIITLEHEEVFFKDDVKYEIIPFWNWALQGD